MTKTLTENQLWILHRGIALGTDYGGSYPDDEDIDNTIADILKNAPSETCEWNPVVGNSLARQFGCDEGRRWQSSVYYGEPKFCPNCGGEITTPEDE